MPLSYTDTLNDIDERVNANCPLCGSEWEGQTSDLSLGERSRQIRNVWNMSLKEVAKRMGKSIAHISQVERGVGNPSIFLQAEVLQATVHLARKRERQRDAERDLKNGSVKSKEDVGPNTGEAESLEGRDSGAGSWSERSSAGHVEAGDKGDMPDVQAGHESPDAIPA